MRLLWRAGLAWLQHEWRWTHHWNDKQNCASAPVVTWPIRKSQSCMFSAFPQWSLPAWRWGNSTHRGTWPVAQLHVISFFGISYRQLSMPKDNFIKKQMSINFFHAISALTTIILVRLNNGSYTLDGVVDIWYRYVQIHWRHCIPCIVLHTVLHSLHTHVIHSCW